MTETLIKAQAQERECIVEVNFRKDAIASSVPFMEQCICTSFRISNGLLRLFFKKDNGNRRGKIIPLDCIAFIDWREEQTEQSKSDTKK